MNNVLLTSWALSGIFSCVVHSLPEEKSSFEKFLKGLDFNILFIISWIWEELNYLTFMYKLWSLKRMLIFMDARNTTENKIQK